MFLVLVLVLLAPLSASAQQMRSEFPWWESPVVRDLNLTEQQMGQIQQITRDARSPMIDFRAEVEKSEADLEDLFNEPQVDQKKASQTIDRVVKARANMMRAFSELSLKLRMVLTPEQWRELQRRQPQMRQGGAGGGRGLGRGMGPGPGNGPGAGPGAGRGFNGPGRQGPNRGERRGPQGPPEPVQPPNPPGPPAEQ